MNEEEFKERIKLVCDPYFDREFFTNLIHCIDRKKTPREVFEAAMNEVAISPSFTECLDKSILHLFYGYQASSTLKEVYQWLPIAGSLYGVSLYRGDGQRRVEPRDWIRFENQGSTLKDLEERIRREVRAVESQKSVWESLLFLLENRSTRAQASAILIRQALVDSDPLTFEMIVKALEVAVASGWKATGAILKRPFDRFWNSKSGPDLVVQGTRLALTQPIEYKAEGTSWNPDWTSELWKRVSEQTPEAAWEFLVSLGKKGASFDQLFSMVTVLRGYALYAMRTEQWPRVTGSVLYAECLQAASRWFSSERMRFLGISLFDLVQVAQLIGGQSFERFSVDEARRQFSRNIPKERLVLRLDDAVERGDRTEALELLSLVLQDQGLSHSVSDRVLLMAAKQDSWTFDF